MGPKLGNVSTLEPLRPCFAYETGKEKPFDASPYAHGSWYGEPRPAYFRTLLLIDGGAGIEWEHVQDLAPRELYERSRVVDVSDA